MTGALLIGVCASAGINQVEASAHQLGVQALAVVVVAVYAWILTTIILKVLDVTMSLRVPEKVQEAGLDNAEYGETAFNLWSMSRKLPD